MAEDDPQTDDDLAAAYVLGVLEADLRPAIARRITEDPAFARLVTRWEADLSDLNQAYVPVPPPAHLKAGLDARLFGPPRPRWRWWRFWAGLGSAVAAVAIAVVLFVPPPQRYIAELRADASAYEMTASVVGDRIEVVLTSGQVPPDRSLEIWQIVGDSAPVSLGIVTGPVVLPPIPFAEGQTVAITLEPLGGAPGGVPTGPVIAAGQLKKIEQG